MTAHLIRTALEHASCGAAYAGGAMRAVVHHPHAREWIVRIVCTKR